MERSSRRDCMIHLDCTGSAAGNTTPLVDAEAVPVWTPLTNRPSSFDTATEEKTSAVEPFDRGALPTIVAHLRAWVFTHNWVRLYTQFKGGETAERPRECDFKVARCVQTNRADSDAKLQRRRPAGGPVLRPVTVPSRGNVCFEGARSGSAPRDWANPRRPVLWAARPTAHPPRHVEYR